MLPTSRRHIARTTVMAVLSALALAASLGCPRPQVEKADLLPERRPGSTGNEGFCQRASSGDLIVRVRNQTNVGVGPTTTRVQFSVGAPVTKPTSPIGGGASADVTFPIPAGCFSPDCGFTITVDADNQVDESHGTTPDNHETNNVAQGICIG